MTNCCTSNRPTERFPRKYPCPVNGKEYSSVKVKTLLHHIQAPWAANIEEQGYYFCDDPNCDVVYFGQDGTVFNKDLVRTPVWQKNIYQDCDVCYCFGVTHHLAKKSSDIKKFIETQTKEGNCSCETRNPSGRCCLKDFQGH